MKLLKKNQHEMTDDCLFCWYWWNWWPSLFRLYFHSGTYKYQIYITLLLTFVDLSAMS